MHIVVFQYFLVADAAEVDLDARGAMTFSKVAVRPRTSIAGVGAGRGGTILPPAYRHPQGLVERIREALRDP